MTLSEEYELKSLLRRNYGLEDDLDYLQQAYIERLRRAHVAAGEKFVLDDPADEEFVELVTRGIRQYLEETLQEESTKTLLDKFKVRHGIS